MSIKSPKGEILFSLGTYLCIPFVYPIAFENNGSDITSSFSDGRLALWVVASY